MILNPLVHSAALQTGLNMSVMSTGLVGAMQLTHAMVPPTPGPLAAVALVGADLPTVILFGSIACLVGALAGWGFALLAGPHIESPPSDEFVGQSFVDQGRESELPSTWRAYAPILIPLALIGGQGVAALTLPAEHLVNAALLYLGWPVVALGIGVLLAYRNTKPEHSEARTATWVEDGLRASAMIIMVTGLGGSLSQILRGTPAVDAIANAVAFTGLPPIFLPVCVRDRWKHHHRIDYGRRDYSGLHCRTHDGYPGAVPRSDHARGCGGLDHHQVRELELLLGVHLSFPDAAEVGAALLWRGHVRQRRIRHGSGLLHVGDWLGLILTAEDEMIHIGPKQRSCAVIIALALLSACGGGSDADLSGPTGRMPER